MALNIKNPRVEELAAEVAGMAGETKTQAIKRALEDRRERLLGANGTQERYARMMRFLENEVWPLVPKKELGRRLTKAEEEKILGYGPDGV